MNWTTLILCFWSASAALGAFLFIVVKPKIRDFEQRGRAVNEHIWELMDRVAQRHASLKRLGSLVTQEQRAYEELQGSVNLLALERGLPEHKKAGFLLVALDVDAGTLEAELELAKNRYGRFFYYFFLSSAAQSSARMIRVARKDTASLLARPSENRSLTDKRKFSDAFFGAPSMFNEILSRRKV